MQSTSLTRGSKPTSRPADQPASQSTDMWEMPPCHLAGAVHFRYKTTFGIGKLTTTRPKMRKYLRDMTADTYYNKCKAAELLMHFRLECLPLNAFHRHERRNESASTRRLRELCPCCQEAVETPTHFLLDCPAYSSSRSLPHIAECIADVASVPVNERWRALLDYQLWPLSFMMHGISEEPPSQGAGPMEGTLWRYHPCLKPISMEILQQPQFEAVFRTIMVDRHAEHGHVEVDVADMDMV